MPMSSIVIWGCNQFSENLYRILQEMNTINVIAFIENSTDLSEFCNKPVLAPSEFKANCEFENIPIVIASERSMTNGVPYIHFEGIRQFKMKMFEILNEHEIENTLFHPAALMELLPITYPDKIITFGVPGAGNVIFNQLLQKISEKCDYSKVKSKAALFFEQMCYEYTQIMHQVISDIIHTKGGSNIYTDPWKIGTTAFHGKFGKDNTLDIYSFPTREHIISSTYGYHLLPSEKYLKKLQELKFKLFFIMRNPLDIILSFLNKSLSINQKTKTINMEAFCKYSRRIITQLEHWHNIISKMNVLDYDELIGRPTEKIQKMMQNFADVLNIGFLRPRKTAIKMAEEMWKQFSFRQLPSASQKHFWKGGSGKWKTYFKAEHLSFLKAFGMESLLAKFSYEETLNSFKSMTASISSDSWKQGCSEDFVEQMSDENIFYHHDENDDASVTFSAIGRKNYTKVGGLILTCEEAKYIENIKDDLMSPYVNKLLFSGFYPEYRKFLI